MGHHPFNVEVERQIDAVLTLKEHLEKIGVDDEDLLQLAIESETQFQELVESILKLEGETAALRKGNDEYVKDLQARSKRFKQREEWCRTIILVAMRQAMQAKLETSFGTVSLKSLPDDVIVLDEAEVPLKYWIEPPRPAPILDKKTLLDDLLARDKALAETANLDERQRKAALKKIEKQFPAIPGATLREPQFTIQIRRK